MTIDVIDTRAPNPPPSWIRKMVKRDGFSDDFRMECDAEADTSTASLVSEALEFSSSGHQQPLDRTGDGNASKEQSLSQKSKTLAPNAANTHKNASQLSRASNDDQVDDQPCLLAGPSSAQSPVLCSTPEISQNKAVLDSRAADILAKLDEVQKICSTTIGVVDALKDDWASKGAEIIALKVTFIYSPVFIK